MNSVRKAPFYVCLMHWPMKNSKGQESASALTNFDVHDFARLCRTYAVDRFFIVHPMQEQRAFAHKIVGHWIAGAGAAMNPDRAEAHSVIQIVASLDEVRAAVRESHPASSPLIVATKSAQHPDDESFVQLRARVFEQQTPVVLCLGTAWGFTDAFLAEADIRLAPVQPHAQYLHLSVRSAAAILIDRILGDR